MGFINLPFRKASLDINLHTCLKDWESLSKAFILKHLFNTSHSASPESHFKIMVRRLSSKGLQMKKTYVQKRLLLSICSSLLFAYEDNIFSPLFFHSRKLPFTIFRNLWFYYEKLLFLLFFFNYIYNYQLVIIRAFNYSVLNSFQVDQLSLSLKFLINRLVNNFPSIFDFRKQFMIT